MLWLLRHRAGSVVLIAFGLLSFLGLPALAQNSPSVPAPSGFHGLDLVQFNDFLTPVDYLNCSDPNTSADPWPRPSYGSMLSAEDGGPVCAWSETELTDGLDRPVFAFANFLPTMGMLHLHCGARPYSGIQTEWTLGRRGGAAANQGSALRVRDGQEVGFGARVYNASGNRGNFLLGLTQGAGRSRLALLEAQTDGNGGGGTPKPATVLADGVYFTKWNNDTELRLRAFRGGVERGAATVISNWGLGAVSELSFVLRVADISDDANSGVIDAYVDGEWVATVADSTFGVIPNASLTVAFAAGCHSNPGGDMLVDWFWLGKSRRCELSSTRAGKCTRWDGDQS